ncbi:MULTISPECIES: WbuC family cupin fold metalloprotein [Bradyrhizobium]|uniref:WbuC family cupin fold metalloprotein n=1 Tax=Bradyrhizobium TaxID=374 RepID=UPI0006886421|nr:MULTISPECIES: WbuC family cupin fold metalloprotein [unclassified Bradyrhizobium]MDA9469206.1 cupin fold metalloprotein, WbuC family [Bradyrhizobium sp. CCBAU 53415]
MVSSSSNDAASRHRRTSLRAQNPEVFYSDDAIVTADDATIAELKRIAAQNPRLRSRLCTHPDPSSGLHEMLIVHHREAYVRPHKHFGKPESFHLIEGTARIIIFEDDGRIRDVLDMAPYGQGKLCYYRMPEEVFHSILITSEWLVFHETTSGPFDPSRTAFPDWAPDGSDAAAVRGYMAKVEALAAAYQGRSPLA